ncbi:hypothetical protein TNCV_495261 [Trichonephila clavipes]|nr:hypothetical protein TNCV_495261 [Trichonephila clavipes]
MKSLVYASPIDSNEALIARIAVVAGDIWEIPGVFASIRQSVHQQCEACILAGRRFKESLSRISKSVQEEFQISVPELKIYVRKKRVSSKLLKAFDVIQKITIKNICSLLQSLKRPLSTFF